MIHNEQIEKAFKELKANKSAFDEHRVIESLSLALVKKGFEEGYRAAVIAERERVLGMLEAARNKEPRTQNLREVI